MHNHRLSMRLLKKYLSMPYAYFLNQNSADLSKNVLEGIGFGGIIVFVLILFVTREDARQVIPLATLFAFAGYRIMPAIQEIFASFSGIQFHEAVLNRIHKDITAPGPAERPASFSDQALPEPLPFKNQIELKSISYIYPNSGEPVLSSINLSIKRNTAVGFVGPTGAGKTTLVDIILGLLLPQAGQMLIDGVPIDENNRLKWQRNLGYVPQFIYLSDDTVARNIAFGRSDQDIDQEALIKAARIANIHDFIINELPAGYDTLVGEQGIRLSGGQRQRIGIARALYHDPEVLVFDKATSALDGVTEETVLAAMESATRLKTLIIIAHRLSTVEPCDMVYLIDRGRIVDKGTYNELIEKNEQFRSMAKAK